jgi:hypothetical protein
MPEFRKLCGSLLVPIIFAASGLMPARDIDSISERGYRDLFSPQGGEEYGRPLLEVM